MVKRNMFVIAVAVTVLSWTTPAWPRARAERTIKDNQVFFVLENEHLKLTIDPATGRATDLLFKHLNQNRNMASQYGMFGSRPTRRVIVRLQHTMPFFNHFEIAIGKKKFKPLQRRRDIKVMDLPDGRTIVRGRCVDVFGKPGYEARLKVKVKPVTVKSAV